MKGCVAYFLCYEKCKSLLFFMQLGRLVYILLGVIVTMAPLYVENLLDFL